MHSLHWRTCFVSWAPSSSWFLMVDDVSVLVKFCWHNGCAVMQEDSMVFAAALWSQMVGSWRNNKTMQNGGIPPWSDTRTGHPSSLTSFSVIWSNLCVSSRHAWCQSSSVEKNCLHLLPRNGRRCQHCPKGNQRCFSRRGVKSAKGIRSSHLHFLSKVQKNCVMANGTGWAVGRGQNDAERKWAGERGVGWIAWSWPEQFDGVGGRIDKSKTYPQGSFWRLHVHPVW